MQTCWAKFLTASFQSLVCFGTWFYLQPLQNIYSSPWKVECMAEGFDCMFTEFWILFNDFMEEADEVRF